MCFEELCHGQVPMLFVSCSISGTGWLLVLKKGEQGRCGVSSLYVLEHQPERRIGKVITQRSDSYFFFLLFSSTYVQGANQMFVFLSKHKFGYIYVTSGN